MSQDPVLVQRPHLSKVVQDLLRIASASSTEAAGPVRTGLRSRRTNFFAMCEYRTIVSFTKLGVNDHPTRNRYVRYARRMPTCAMSR